jgi:cytochrome c biogenesis protein CcmG/thiol:disulfide interchange protein DsbE
MRLLVVGLSLVVALAGLAWALTLGLSPRPDVVVVGRSPLLDAPAPAFELPTLDGGQAALADYRGRPVIVNFWASWCIPCRQEFPLLAAARDRHAASGLEILGIVHDDGPEAARAFAAAHGGDWPLLLDAQDGAWTAYGGVLLPITFFIDRTGIVRAVSYGPPPSGTLEEQIAKIL